MRLPNPDDPRLTVQLDGFDQTGAAIVSDVVVERPLTLFLNGQEIVTMMTIGDYREELALGYLLNQNMLTSAADIVSIDVDDELDVVVVRTNEETNFEEKLKRKTLTSGCAQGTVFGDMMEKFEQITLDQDARLKVSSLRRPL